MFTRLEESSSRTVASGLPIPDRRRMCSLDRCTFHSCRARQPCLLNVPPEEEISWLEPVAEILNIDRKVSGKELEPGSESWKHFYNNKNYIKQGLKEIKTELWEVQFVIVSDFYIDFIPQWGKIDSSDIYFVFICDSHMDAFIFLGVLKMRWGWSSEHSFDSFLQYFYLVCGLLEL